MIFIIFLVKQMGIYSIANWMNTSDWNLEVTSIIQWKNVHERILYPMMVLRRNLLYNLYVHVLGPLLHPLFPPFLPHFHVVKLYLYFFLQSFIVVVPLLTWDVVLSLWTLIQFLTYALIIFKFFFSIIIQTIISIVIVEQLI